ncbi:MAG: FHA domain-containing protein [Myxococcota bacterium]|nr:FHA domain-containing protein [Myxococcota bacterium]
MITCPKCSKDNQDHYKFCLGCGAELPRDVGPKPFGNRTPPHGMKPSLGAVAPSTSPVGFGGTVAIPPGAAAGQAAPVPGPVLAAAPIPPAAAAPVPGEPPAPAAASAAVAAPVATTANDATVSVACPQCGHINSQSNLFCGSCGYRLADASARSAAHAVAPVPVTEDPVAGTMMLTALRADGSEAGTHRLPPGGGTIGRESGGIFAGDSYLSPRHATFRATGPGRAGVKDEKSLNGVYKKLARDLPVELRPNDVFRIGQEIIKYEPFAALAPSPDGVERLGAPSKGYIGRIALIIGREETGNAFPIPESGVHLGRERGDILFPEDGYVSGLHCRLSWDGQKLFLTDLGSSNGTFQRIAEADLRSGDVLLMGQQLFRVSL